MHMHKQLGIVSACECGHQCWRMIIQRASACFAVPKCSKVPNYHCGYRRTILNTTVTQLELFGISPYHRCLERTISGSKVQTFGKAGFSTRQHFTLQRTDSTHTHTPYMVVTSRMQFDAMAERQNSGATHALDQREIHPHFAMRSAAELRAPVEAHLH